MSFQLIEPRPGVLVEVAEGPELLSELDVGPGMAAHRELFGVAESLGVTELSDKVVALRGRGGAGFPFATKLAAVAGQARRRPGANPVVVVNGAEGEPASAKDAALLALRPHLVFDGAEAAASALHASDLHVVVGSDATQAAVRRAIAERASERGRGRLRWSVHRAADRFVAGQSRAIIELMSGRTNLPVTSWAPEAVSGYRGRPTLLSNTETFAQVAAALAGRGGSSPGQASGEEGTTLLTLGRQGRPELVREVPLGSAWRHVLGAEQSWTSPVLLGGYHGTWARPGELASLTISRTALAESGLCLGAGVVQLLGDELCPVVETVRILAYLARESALRCGPCAHGLPALARVLAQVASGVDERRQLRHLVGLVEGRGACAHPDGTARLVRSLLEKFPGEVDAHLDGDCCVRLDARRGCLR